MAGDLNKAMIIGRLGQDPKVNYTPAGKAVANLSVATSEKWKDQSGQWQERTEWHRVTVWGPSAEFCGNYLGKGRLVYVEGKIQTRKWTDQNTGQDKYATEIVVQGPGSTVQALDRAPEQGQAQQGGYQQNRPQQNNQQQTRSQEEEDLGPAFPSDASGIDDVPF